MANFSNNACAIARIREVGSGFGGAPARAAGDLHHWWSAHSRSSLPANRRGPSPIELQCHWKIRVYPLRLELEERQTTKSIKLKIQELKSPAW